MFAALARTAFELGAPFRFLPFGNLAFVFSGNGWFRCGEVDFDAGRRVIEMHTITGRIAEAAKPRENVIAKDTLKIPHGRLIVPRAILSAEAPLLAEFNRAQAL